MVFSSTIFLFIFLPVTFAGCMLSRGRIRNIWLLIMSLIFFSWSQPGSLWVILLSIGMNYAGALAMETALPGKAVLTVVITGNLLLLFIFKYLDFTVTTINLIPGIELGTAGLVLPIGISFFTFQGMSYLADVYRGRVRASRDPLKVALYIALFPQLVAGPIVRYTDIAGEIDERKTTVSDLSSGITRFITGLAKKAIIANTMAELTDSIWNAGISNNTVAIAWLGSIAYSLQIFFDFSGYSDMAIGLGRMLGFHFCENFDRPYISSSITEFWRRWHMSLSSWFRDYVYIPLGGNKKHVYRNLFIVFLLTGIWHGAAWTFIIWGLWNAFFIIAERLLGKREGKGLISHVYTLFAVNLGWVIFRADTLENAVRYIGTMFGIGLSETPGFTIMWYLDAWSVSVLLLGILLCTGIPAKLTEMAGKKGSSMYRIAGIAAYLGLFVFSVMRIMSGTYNPFIYFQF